MLQLILHLIGDYVTQSHWMAQNKTKCHEAAAAHAIVYSLPFAVVFDTSGAAFCTILTTHFVIDRYRLARYVVFARNWAWSPELKWAECSETGFPKESPPWMAVWLLILADNTIHLAINYAALRWL